MRHDGSPIEKVTPARIQLRLRPLRLAFLVRPDNKADLLKAIQANTCIWGGRFNPIIPVARRKLKRWHEHEQHLSSRDVVHGYLRAFEPDYVVEVHGGLADDIGLDKNKILSLDRVLSGTRANCVSYGIDVLDLYRELYQKEFQFVRRHPRTIVDPVADKREFMTFVSTCFGAFPRQEGVSHFGRNYRDVFDAQGVRVSASNLYDVYDAAFTPLRIGSEGLTYRRVQHAGLTLFLLDASSSWDLVEFWNLRAIGWKVLPVPAQWGSQLSAKLRVILTEELHFQNHTAHGRRSFRRVLLLKAHSVAQEQLLSLANELGGTDNRLVLQEWYPRMWHDDARDWDRAQRCEVSAEESDVDTTVSGGYVSFQPLAPKFVEKYSRDDHPRWANVVTIRPFSPDSEWGEIVPPTVDNIASLIRTTRREHVSICSEGFVLQCQHAGWTQRWFLPDGLSIFKAWLEKLGFTAELSGAGKIATQLLRSLGGPQGAGLIAHQEILEQLNRMAHGLVESAKEQTGDEKAEGIVSKPRVRGRTASVEKWLGLLKKVNGGADVVAKRQLESLVSRSVLRLGLKLSCTQCTQTNWYPLDELADQIKCERCLRFYPFPSTRAAKPDDWCYRTQGAFSVENYAQGGYAVALVLRFLTVIMHADVSWVPNIEIRGQNKVHFELDFAVWWKRGWETRADLLIGECKSFGQAFSKTEVDHARAIAQKFPGAVFVFSTLRHELEKAEKELLAKLVRSRRQSTANKSPRDALVLILTAHELMGSVAPPHCWKNKGGRFTAAAAAADRRPAGLSGLRELCRATQFLHLGMDDEGE